MKVEKLNKDNIEEFMRDLAITDNSLINDISKFSYFGVRDENTFYMAFLVLPLEDRIAIRFVGNRISSDKFMECIDYLNESLVVKSHLIVQVYDDKYMNVLDAKYRGKDMCFSLNKNIVDGSDNVKEKYAEIDMYNIRYLDGKNGVICNLMKQNIQDEDIIRRLSDYFKDLDTANISFITNDGSYEYLKELGYNLLYKSYVIE